LIDWRLFCILSTTFVDIFTSIIIMCKIQQPVYISIPVTDGNEESAHHVVVATDGISNFEASRAKGRGESQRTGSVMVGILLRAGILALMFAGSPCPCSFHASRNDYSKGDVFLTGGAAMGSLEPSLEIRDPSMHQDSPLKINAHLRYAPPRPISPEASSMESPSEEDGYKLRKRGSSPSYTSEDVVRNGLESDESSDSINASEDRIASEDESDADSVASTDGHDTLITLSSEDVGSANSSDDYEPAIITTMTPRRYI
jgi:hypothetical protein